MEYGSYHCKTDPTKRGGKMAVSRENNLFLGFIYRVRSTMTPATMDPRATHVSEKGQYLHWRGIMWVVNVNTRGSKTISRIGNIDLVAYFILYIYANAVSTASTTTTDEDDTADFSICYIIIIAARNTHVFSNGQAQYYQYYYNLPILIL